MYRSLFLGSIVVLLVLTGTAMISGAIFVPPSPLPPPATSDTDTIHRFYAAINDVIATGDPSRLDAVVAPYFVARNPLPGVEAGRGGLEQYLVTLHHVDASLRLVPEVVAAVGDLAVARVTVRRAQEPPIFAGATVDPPPWGSVDVLRIAENTIVERWGDTDGIGLVRLLAEHPVDLPAPAPRIATIDRFALDAGAQWHSQATGPHLLFAEEGALRVKGQEEAGLGSEAAPAQQTARLIAGESMVVPAGASFVVTNVGGGAARVVVVKFAVAQSLGGAPITATLPPDVAGKTLANGITTDVEVGPAVLTMGQMILGSGTQISLAGAEGLILIAVDAGHVGITVSQPAWILSGANRMSHQGREATLAPGDGALLHSEGFAVLRNAGDDPVSALVLMLEADPLTAPDAAIT
jgi:hypothetical protein